MSLNRNSRWRLLRDALSGRQEDLKISIHRHRGFEELIISNEYKQVWEVEESLLDLNGRNIQPYLDTLLEEIDMKSCVFQIISKSGNSSRHIRACHSSEQYKPAVNEKHVKFKRYVLPDEIKVLTRERYQTSIDADGLLSNIRYGIDNTGNVKVWISEQILLYYILSNINVREEFSQSRVLELGGGMTALCSLGLAVSGCCLSVTATDGHPVCVKNISVCEKLNKNSFQSPFYTKKLKWSTTYSLELEDVLQVVDADSEVAELHDKEKIELNEHAFKDVSVLSHKIIADNGYSEEKEIETTSSFFSIPPEICQERKGFDRIIASDCLFFTDFHLGLLCILRNMLSTSGKAYLLQPRRGATLDRFLNHVRESVCFQIEIVEDYLPDVSALHEEYCFRNTNSESQDEDHPSVPLHYDSDIHYPILVILSKINS